MTQLSYLVVNKQNVFWGTWRVGLNVKELSPLRFKCVRNEEYRWYLQIEGLMEIVKFKGLGLFIV